MFKDLGALIDAAGKYVAGTVKISGRFVKETLSGKEELLIDSGWVPGEDVPNDVNTFDDINNPDAVITFDDTNDENDLSR